MTACMVVEKITMKQRQIATTMNLLRFRSMELSLYIRLSYRKRSGSNHSPVSALKRGKQVTRAWNAERATHVLVTHSHGSARVF